MELRHHACRNESRDRHHWRWKRVSVEMSDNARGGYDAVKKFAEANVKCEDATPFLSPAGGSRCIGWLGTADEILNCIAQAICNVDKRRIAVLPSSDRLRIFG